MDLDTMLTVLREFTMRARNAYVSACLFPDRDETGLGAGVRVIANGPFGGWRHVFDPRWPLNWNVHVVSLNDNLICPIDEWDRRRRVRPG